jgi:O-antigen/teichoic acid export membrane protein
VKPFDANGVFRPIGEDRGALRRVAVQSAGVTVFSQSLAFAIQMIATVVLARLLSPNDFGVIVMVSTFSTLLASFGLNGFTEGVLQLDQIDHGLSSNLFWVNSAVGLVLTTGFAATGSLLARFYGNPHVASIAVPMSATIFLSNISVMHLALLKRAMRFTMICANDIVARAASVAVSILGGLAGWGYWALVAGAITLPLTTAIGAWSLCRWTPGRPRRIAGTGSMVRYAFNIYWHYIVSYSKQNLDNLLVGWRFGAPALGFYKKAYDLFVFSASQLLGPVAPVVIATLSRVNKESERYRRHFLGGLSILAFIGMFAGGDITLIGKDVIRVLLGPAWGETGRIFTYFGPGIGIMLIYDTHSWLHLSIGRADRWFRWGIIELVVTGLMFVVALPFGPAGVALAWTASFWVLAIPAFWYAGMPIDFGIRPVIDSVWKYFVASLAAGLACTGIVRMIPALFAGSGAAGAATRIVTVSTLFGVLYLGAVILLYRGFAPLHQIMRLLPDLLPWRSRSSSPYSAEQSPVAEEIVALALTAQETVVPGGE